MSIFKKTMDAQPLGRNSFDLSQKRLFSASAGELLPCYCVEVIPGDKFKIRVTDFLRTQTCNTAAFSRMKQYVHFFYVPTKLLSSQFPQYVMRSPRTDSTAFKPFKGLANDVTFARFRRAFTFPYYRALVNTVKKLNTIGISDYESLAAILNDPAAQSNLEAYRTLKLLDLLEYGVGNIKYHELSAWSSSMYKFGEQDLGTGQENSVRQTRLSMFPLLAYNRIYQDFYRDQRLETFNSIYSNIDDLSLEITSLTSPNFDSKSLDGLILNRFQTGAFQIRFRNYPKDYFTCSDVNPFQQGNLLNRLPYTDLPTTPQLGNLGVAAGTSVSPVSVQNGVFGTSFPILQGGTPQSAAQMRALYALERWASRQSHARSQSYSDLVKAHFGISVNDSDDSARFLGGQSAPIVINENISTASTETASLGSLSGVGKSVMNDQTISFDVKQHGYIMGIFSIAPEPDYNSYGPTREVMHQLPEDFFTPEFDGLGYQAVNSMEFANVGVTELDSALKDRAVKDLNTTFGFMPIYSEYRTKVDKVFGEFRTDNPLSYWVNSRRIGDYNQTITNAFVKVMPFDLDPIFQVNWVQKTLISDSTPDAPTIGGHVALRINDQFFVNMNVDCKAIRHMSNDGTVF